MLNCVHLYSVEYLKELMCGIETHNLYYFMDFALTLAPLVIAVRW